MPRMRQASGEDIRGVPCRLQFGERPRGSKRQSLHAVSPAGQSETVAVRFRGGALGVTLAANTVRQDRV